MTKDEIIKKTEEIFTSLYREGASHSFRFPKGYSANVIKDFADIILERESGMVSLGFLTDYCIHHAYLWRDASRWKGFTIVWAFGIKGIDRFYAAKSGARFYQDLWLKDMNLSREGLKFRFTTHKVHPLKKFIYMPSEETTKKKLYNQLSGKVLCSLLTTLYAPQSEACKGCVFSAECESSLKANNPELHRLRMFNTETK